MTATTRSALAGLAQVSKQMQLAEVTDFELLVRLLVRREQFLQQLGAEESADTEVRAALEKAVEETSRLHIRIQAERRRLCLEAAVLRNQQRLLLEIKDSGDWQDF